MRLLLPLLAFVLLGPAAQAASPSPTPSSSGGVSVVPARGSAHLTSAGNALQAQGLRPGQGFTDTVVVLNTSDRALRIALYPADGVRAQTGGYGYTYQGDALTSVGAWLALSEQQLTIPARGQHAVGLRLTVGAGAFNGRNVGAVVAEPLDQGQTGPVQSVTRYAMPVLVSVAGGRPAPTGSASAVAPRVPSDRPVRLTGLRPGRRGRELCPTAVLENATSAPVTVSVVVTSSSAIAGHRSMQRAVLPTVPSLSATRVALPCVRRPLGPGRLQVAAAAPGQQQQITSAQLFYVPIPLALALFLLLLLLAALLDTGIRGARRRER